MGKFLQVLGLKEVAVESEGKINEGVVDTLKYRLEESLGQLELARENAGWAKVTWLYQEEFTREGLRRSAEQGRVLGVADPLVKRGRNVRHAYVWGQGVDVGARDEAVSDVIQGFIDEDNREAFYGAQARQEYGLIQADAIKAETSSTRASGATAATVTDTSTFTNLRIKGLPAINANVAPNTVVQVAGLGTVTLHKVSKSSSALNVTMIDVVISQPIGALPTGSRIKIGYSSTAVTL